MGCGAMKDERDDWERGLLSHPTVMSDPDLFKLCCTKGSKSKVLVQWEDVFVYLRCR